MKTDKRTEKRQKMKMDCVMMNMNKEMWNLKNKHKTQMKTTKSAGNM